MQHSCCVVIVGVLIGDAALLPGVPGAGQWQHPVTALCCAVPATLVAAQRLPNEQGCQRRVWGRVVFGALLLIHRLLTDARMGPQFFEHLLWCAW